MTVHDFLDFLAGHRLIVIIYFVALPILALMGSLAHRKAYERNKFLKYFLSVVSYLSCLPGILTAFLVLYLAAFQKINLANLDIFAYYLPPVSMFLTLIIIRKNTTFDTIPGFKKITGLFFMALASFVILLILERLRIYLFFRGPIWLFVLLWIGIIAFLKLASTLIFGKFKKNANSYGPGNPVPARRRRRKF